MRTLALLLAAAAAAVCVQPGTAQGSAALNQAIQDREAEVRAIATTAKTLLSGTAPCTSRVRECSECTVNACYNDMSGLTGSQCSLEFGDPSTGSDCSGRKPGQLIDTSKSIVRLADSVPSGSAEEPRTDICATQGLDATFMENRNSNAQSANNLKYQYFGSVNGMHRSYPGRVWGFSSFGCTAYDPRVRPWYVAGASGAKRLVLVLDRSGSMGSLSVRDSRINVALAAARSVLETLTSADYAQVVSFSTTATVQGNGRLLPMNEQNREALTRYVDSISPAGGTNFADALSTTFNVLDNSQAQEIGSTACRSVILFLTDGAPENGDAAVTRLENWLAGLPAERRDNTFLFTYTLGPDADTRADLQEYPKRMACIGNGVWAPITNNANLRTKMVQYYQFLATGIQRDSVVWVEPYEDINGLGLVTTASLPVYDDTVSPPALLGVAGVDITMSDFNSLAANPDDVLSALISRSQVCGANTFNNCTVELLRGDHACNETLAQQCRAGQDSVPACSIPLPSNPDPFCAGSPFGGDAATYKDLRCCDPEESSAVSGALVGGIIGGVVALIAVAAIVFYCVKRASGSKAPPPVTSSTPAPASAPAPAPAPAPAYPAPATHRPPGANLSYYNTGGAPHAQPGMSYPPPSAGYPAPGGTGYPPAGGPGAPPGYPPANPAPTGGGYV